MKTKIIRVGNSRGIRIPKSLLEETGLTSEVEITAHGNRLVIAPARRPRAGWLSTFRRMHDRGDDTMLDGEASVATKWEDTEWEW